MAVEAAPFGFAFAPEFIHHPEGGAPRAAALGLTGAVAHHGEARFDDMGGAQMHPMGGGKIVKGQQCGAILFQALPGFGVFVCAAFPEGAEGFPGVRASVGEVGFDEWLPWLRRGVFWAVCRAR